VSIILRGIPCQLSRRAAGARMQNIFMHCYVMVAASSDKHNVRLSVRFFVRLYVPSFFPTLIGRVASFF